MSGFGSEGPGSKRPAFDQVAQAMGGGMSITGAGPESMVRAGIPIGDLGGGMFGVMGILAALYERERSGLGQHVDISMLDCQISMLNYMATMHFLSEEDPYPIGNSHFVHVPYNTFRCSDGSIVIAVITDNFWTNLKGVLNCADFENSKYDTQPGRWEDRDMINARLNELLSVNSCAYWLALFEAQRIPCAPVNTLSQALADTQVLHRNMVVDLKHPNGNSTKGPGNPIKLSRSSDEVFTAAPTLGQHTDEVMTQLLNLSVHQIQQMKDQGIIK